MFRQALNNFSGSELSDEDYLFVMDMATQDILGNKAQIKSQRMTYLHEVLVKVLQCFITYKKLIS